MNRATTQSMSDRVNEPISESANGPIDNQLIAHGPTKPAHRNKNTNTAIKRSDAGGIHTEAENGVDIPTDVHNDSVITVYNHVDGEKEECKRSRIF